MIDFKTMESDVVSDLGIGLTATKGKVVFVGSGRRTVFVAAEKDGTGARMSLRRRKIEPEAECRCGGERWNRRPNVVAAEKDGTGERMSLRRGRLRPPRSF